MINNQILNAIRDKASQIVPKGAKVIHQNYTFKIVALLCKISRFTFFLRIFAPKIVFID